MSRTPHRPPAEQAPAATARPGRAVVVLATLAVLVTASDTYVVVLALPDILTGIGVGIDELQRATPIIGGFLLGYTATLPLLGRPRRSAACCCSPWARCSPRPPRAAARPSPAPMPCSPR